MRKATKTIISFAVVLIAGLNFVVLAIAQDPFGGIAIGGLTGASGAGLFSSMAGMSGVNLQWGNNDPVDIDAIWSSIHPDHVYFSGEKHEADPQIDPEDVYDYITVDLQDWLSAQSDFIVGLIQEYNLTDNDSGNIETDPLWNGVPDGYTEQVQGGPPLSLPGGVEFLNPQPFMTNRVIYNVYYNDSYVTNAALSAERPSTMVYVFETNGVRINIYENGSLITYITVGGQKVTKDADYTTSTINTTVFDGWENAKVKIPRNISGLGPNWTIPEFLGAINNLWVNHQQGQIVIEDTDTPVPPPPVPVPSTPLGEVPFDDWVDLWGQGIYQQLENQSDALDLIGSNGIDAIEELESIDTNTEDLVEVAESIDTNIGVGNGILGGIRSLAQSAVNYLEGIAEHVGELVEEIVEGTETLIAGILNQIPQVFSVIFGPIKQASSIWHYVVEWIQSIGAPFQFILSMASGTSYYIILPVYASLAAAVVLAFYKRFGK